MPSSRDKRRPKLSSKTLASQIPLTFPPVTTQTVEVSRTPDGHKTCVISETRVIKSIRSSKNRTKIEDGFDPIIKKLEETTLKRRLLDDMAQKSEWKELLQSLDNDTSLKTTMIPSTMKKETKNMACNLGHSARTVKKVTRITKYVNGKLVESHEEVEGDEECKSQEEPKSLMLCKPLLYKMENVTNTKHELLESFITKDVIDI